MQSGKQISRRALVAMMASVVVVPGLSVRPVAADDDRFKVVTTTTQLTDLARNVGGDTVSVEGIMRPGVDPHLYRASESDLELMFKAEAIFYNGLHLEGQMTEALDLLGEEKPVTSRGALVPDDQRLTVPNFPDEADPHFWFSPTLWMIAAQGVADSLAEADSANAERYQQNAAAYIAELEAFDAEATEMLSAIPESQRVLVTAHDAFGYFGDHFGFEVIGIQGLSTETEAGVSDMQRVADRIIESNVPAIFIESTISPATIEAVQAAVADRGGEVVIGGQLFSDAMGEDDTPEGTYIGMYRHNVTTIVQSYTGGDVATPGN